MTVIEFLHTYAHTHTHARTHSRTHAHMHVRTHTHRHTHTHTHKAQKELPGLKKDIARVWLLCDLLPRSFGAALVLLKCHTQVYVASSSSWCLDPCTHPPLWPAGSKTHPARRWGTETLHWSWNKSAGLSVNTCTQTRWNGHRRRQTTNTDTPTYIQTHTLAHTIS